MAISKKAKICGILSAVEVVFGIITIVAFPYLYDLILESVSNVLVTLLILIFIILKMSTPIGENFIFFYYKAVQFKLTFYYLSM